MSLIPRSGRGLVVFVWLGLVVVAAARADDFRTWTDSTGRYTLRAKLVSVADGQVTLVRENGNEVTISLEKLSKADRDYLAKLDAESPFKAGEDSPFTPVPPTTQKSRSGPRTVEVDWSDSEMIMLEAADSEWHLTPRSAPPSDFRPRSIALPAKTDFFEHLVGMGINPVAKKAVVGYTLKRPASKEATTRIVICDLERRRASASRVEPGEMAPLALHDDGRHVLMRRNEFGFGNQDRLEIWSLEGGHVVRSLVWTPYADADGAARDVMWAEFIDAKTLATSSRGGRVALWNIASVEPVCHFQLSDGAVPTLSADRKWIVFGSDESMGVFDVGKREVIALQKTPSRLAWPYMALSPSGSKIGCIARDHILVWDTASGRLEKDFTTPGINIHGAIDFPNDGFILADNQYLIAIESQLKLWHYQGAEQVRTIGGMTFLAVSGDQNSGALLLAKMPHAGALSALKQTVSQPDMFVFRKGTPVKLDVSGIPPAQSERVKEALSKKLREMNCPIGTTGQVDVVASVEGPTQREVSYIASGDYTVQEYLTRLKIVYQGKTLWETGGTNVPGFLMLKEGENIEGVLRKASQGPSCEFFDHVVLPEFLQKPSEDSRAGRGQTIGASSVTAKGLR